MWAGSAAPANYLECNGSPLSTTTYAVLFKAIGYAWGGSGTTFYLPDGRGYFPRGYSNTATKDPDKATRTNLQTGGNTGNAVGSYQSHNIYSHTHATSNIGVLKTASSGGIETSATVTNQNGVLDVNGQEASGAFTETRPVNFSVMFCVRYQ